MKILKIFSVRMFCVTLIIFNTAGCRTKLLNFEKMRISEVQTEDRHILSKYNESLRSNRIVFTSDSDKQFYRVSIFPLDTFSFSLQDGFKGRASSIEVTGVRYQVKTVSDSAGFVGEEQGTIQFDHVSKRKETAVLSTKVLEKKMPGWKFGLIVIVLLGVIVWVWGRFWKN